MYKIKQSKLGYVVFCLRAFLYACIDVCLKANVKDSVCMCVCVSVCVCVKVSKYSDLTSHAKW